MQNSALKSVLKRCGYRCAQSDVCVAVCVAKATSVMSYEDLCAAFLHFRNIPGAGVVASMHHWLQQHNSGQHEVCRDFSSISQNVMVRFAACFSNA